MVKFAQLPKYEAYKDSGVEWLGEIPKYWNVRKLKYLLKEVNHRSEDGKENLLSVSQYTGVTLRSNKLSEGDLLTNAESLEGYKIVKVNDLVSNIMLAWNGSLGFSNYDGIVSPAYAVYRLNAGLDQQFFHYLLRTDLYKAEYKRQSTGVIESRLRLYTDSFYDIFGLLPSAVEQTLIANFLDQKTTQIDAAIAIKEQQIELLKERKQIIIQQAVTQGLDPNVPMKDSGVDWIGKIPAHWVVSVMNFAIDDVGDVDHYMPPSVEDGVPYFMTGDLKNLVSEMNFDNCKKVKHSDFKKLTKKIRNAKGDVILARYATIGTATYVDINEDFLISYSCVTIKPNATKLLGLYLFYYFKSDSFFQDIRNQVNTNTQGNVGINDLKRVKLALPPISEQESIIDLIEMESKHIDTAIELQNLQIEKLKEYKTTLINSAVTGKIKITPEMLQA